MPDYDPTSIPILDDVVEIEETENTDDEVTSSLLETEPVQAENNLDLFADESTDFTADSLEEDQTSGDVLTNDSSAEENEPQIGIIDDIIDEDIDDIHTGNIETDKVAGIIETEETAYEDSVNISTDDSESETDDIESALIDYDADAEENDAVDETQPVEDEPQMAEQTVSLESVVEGIARQLMPDLEMQLRFLIQQALEDRLPDDVINKLTRKNDKS